MNGMQIVFDVIVVAALIYLWRRQRGFLLKCEQDKTTPDGGLPEPTTAERVSAAIDAHEAEFHRR